MQLGAPCVADYDPAQAAAQLETTVSADDLQPVVPSSVPSSVPSVVSNTKEAADVVPPQEAAASAVPPPDAPAVSGSAASAIAAAFAAAEEVSHATPCGCRAKQTKIILQCETTIACPFQQISPPSGI